MSWFIGITFIAMLIWVFRGASKRLNVATQRGDMVSYQAGSPERNWSLALAHPMAYHAMSGGFAQDLNGADDALAQQLRPMVLHHLGMRTDFSDAQALAQLPDTLRQRWFMLDLLKPHAGDDPRASMAFACARVAFYVRCAFLLGWLPAELHWEVLMLNARRAQQCFGSWQEFGTAYAQGRQQWIAQGRADVLGTPVSSEEVVQWTTEAQHPWHAMDWQLPLAAEDVQPSGAPMVHAGNLPSSTLAG